MAREGLRTLVVAKKVLTEDQYQEFEVCTFICIGRKTVIETLGKLLFTKLRLSGNSPIALQLVLV